MKRIIVGISGATGAICGIRLLEVLRGVGGVETHLVLSPAARRTLVLETDLSVEQVEAIAHYVYKPGDIAAAISSGSFRAAGMVVGPCSIKTVSGIATSYSDNLLLRAADVTLKDRRPLVLFVHETPLHLGHLRLLVQVAEIGAVVMPPVPAFYHRPVTLEEVAEPLFVVTFKTKGGTVATRRMSGQRIWKVVKDTGQRVGIPQLHPHAFRHACGAEFLRRTHGNLRAVQEHLRHKDVQTTTVYTKITQEDLRQQSRVFDEGDGKRDSRPSPLGI